MTTEATTQTILTVSGVCVCSRCEANGRHIYRMIGRCWNCKTEPILMLFRAGERTMALDCPLCGCREVHAFRRATDDEIPESVVEPESGVEQMEMVADDNA